MRANDMRKGDNPDVIFQMARLAGQFDQASSKATPPYLNEGTRSDRKPTTGGESKESSVKEYAERVGKYVPAEIVAAYTAANGILAGVDPHDSAKLAVSICVFFLCLVCTPLYLNLMSQPGQARRTQLIVSTVAFVVWATGKLGGHKSPITELWSGCIGFARLGGLLTTGGLVRLGPERFVNPPVINRRGEFRTRTLRYLQPVRPVSVRDSGQEPNGDDALR